MGSNRNILYFTLIALVGAALFCADVLLGTVSISLSEMLTAFGIGGAVPATEPDAMDTDTIRSIITNFRIPKAVVAVLAGAGLSASGLQMQTLFRNPLAGPFVLGVSSGASLGAAMFIMGLPLVGLSAASEVVRNLGTVGAAWVGGAAILLVVMAVSARIKDIMAILILGMMFGSAASAFVEILQYMSPEGALKSYAVWTMGSLGGVTAKQLAIMAPVMAAGLLISVLMIKPLNILLLGENYARTMGVNIKLVRGMIFVSTILLASTVTAFCGPIGFIGIAVPHVARMLFANADHRVLMPASMLLGVAVMLLCDIVSQMPGQELSLPINTITALLGIPIVVLVIMRNRKVV